MGEEGHEHLEKGERQKSRRHVDRQTDRSRAWSTEKTREHREGQKGEERETGWKQVAAGLEREELERWGPSFKMQPTPDAPGRGRR